MKQDMFGKRVRSYLYGLGTSLMITSAAFLLVMAGNFHGAWAVGLLLLLAISQMIVQLYCFLHLGEEKRPWWKSVSMVFTLMTVVILVGGALWVIMNLNYNMGMSPEQMNEFMKEQANSGF